MKALLLVLLAAAPVAAQVTPPLRPPSGPGNTVTVVGEATVYAPPDQAQLQFGVETVAATPEEAFRRHEQDVQNVLTVVRRLGIPDRHIQLQWVGLGEHRDDRGNADGYVATRYVTVTTDSLRLVPDLVAAVVDAGATNLGGLQFTLEDDARFEDLALQQALDRARDKARVLAQASGLRLDPVLLVSEQGIQPPVPILYQAERLQMDAAGTPGAYSTGQSAVHASVIVTFQLEAP